MLPPLTFGRAVTTLVADPLGIVAALGLAIGYAVCLVRAQRRGRRWPVLRTIAFYLLGVGSLVVATCGALAAYRGVLFWTATAQAAVLSAVTPIGLALGDPVGLVRAALGESRGDRLVRLLRSPVARALTFPLVSSVLAVATLVVVFFTPYFAATVRSPLVRELLYAHLLVTGSLFVLPLLGEEMLPAWCTHPVRALIAFADGLLDAVPGILLMTAPRLVATGVPGLFTRRWGPTPVFDQRLAGGAMLGVAEVIGLPFLAVVFVAWMRADEAEGRAFDREQDVALSAARPGAGAAAGVADESGGSPDADVAAPQLDRPWWETDPRFRDRYR